MYFIRTGTSINHSLQVPTASYNLFRHTEVSLGKQRTVKLFYPSSSGERDCRISQFSGYQSVMPNVYLNVFSTLMDRPKPIFHLIYCSTFLVGLPISLLLQQQVAHTGRFIMFSAIKIFITRKPKNPP
jgi:hypothetical protein